MPTRTLHTGPEPWFPHEASKWSGAEILALLISLSGILFLEVVTAACFSVEVAKVSGRHGGHEIVDRNSPHPFTGSSSPSVLKMCLCFPPDLVSSGFRHPTPPSTFLLFCLATQAHLPRVFEHLSTSC